MTAFNWTCPYCQHPQTVVEQRTDRILNPIHVGKTADGPIAAITTAIGCANPACNRTTVSLSIRKTRGPSYDELIDNNIKPLFNGRIIPNGTAKPQPDYIPIALVEDYTEACLIRDLSPKASATLARRCIQGMIRDFCNITKGRLIDEITALQNAVESGTGPSGVTIETVEAIDHVRSIGNIGAHMEKDIDLIVPVEPDEAQALIGLIEMLFEEWYVARHVRQQKLAAISRIGTEKKQFIETERVKKKALAAPPSSEADPQ